MTTRTPIKVQVELSKACALRSWLMDNGITLDEIARAWGVQKAQVSRRLSGMACSANQKKILENQFNVPCTLLPEITDGKPGPKPQKDSEITRG